MVSSTSGPLSGPPVNGGDPRSISAVLSRVQQLETSLVAHIDHRLATIDRTLGAIHELFASARKEQLRVEEFAKLVGKSPYTIRRWIGEGKIKAVRLADGGPKGRWLIARGEVDRLIATGSGQAISDAFISSTGCIAKSSSVLSHEDSFGTPDNHDDE